jgi:hypothetical protein
LPQFTHHDSPSTNPRQIEGFVLPNTLEFWVSVHIVGIWIGRFNGNFANKLTLDIQLLGGKLVFSKKENCDDKVMYRCDLQVGQPLDASFYQYNYWYRIKPETDAAAPNTDMGEGKDIAEEEL